ncbi:RBBP9/YdeN family alpha/beta hydrolase [Microbacterium sp. M1A1_1b]|uniref:RBBP9/YdeN family alpha/beta hydrolase n=1 Tax=Curtobacterium sp. VKM Ac-2922 TaxID=2929475 RepID=UPI001FB24517|nr:alpha/beta fold hydrolase [Curtobacterium sp. VKM Ac-2922]MCJ1715475.1 alpha/beta fold hydrolase [Curtobacterium sp. VKM Ac-2922]
MRRPRPWVIVPGIWNSDPEHWQSRWQAERPGSTVRIAPTSWSEPDPDDWSRAIDRAVAAVDEPPVLVAHSLGVIAAWRWLVDHDDGRVAGAFLVAPPDPAATGFPTAAAGFTLPDRSVTTPTALVVSDDDPYCSLDRALTMAVRIGAETHRIGAHGHVNVASGLGDWPIGRDILEDFSARC